MSKKGAQTKEQREEKEAQKKRHRRRHLVLRANSKGTGFRLRMEDISE